MASISSLLTSSLLYLSSILSIAHGQASIEPRGHGLSQENPMSISPSAFDFFHPRSPLPVAKMPCSESGDCVSLPVTSFSGEFTKPEATQVHGSFDSMANGSRVGAGGIAGIILSCIFVVFLAMGVYYIVIKRRPNMNGDNTVQPVA